MRRISVGFCIILALLVNCVAFASGEARPKEESVFLISLRSTHHGYDYASVEVRPSAGVAVLVTSRERGPSNHAHVRGAAYAVRIPKANSDLGPTAVTFGEHGSIEGEVALVKGQRELVFRGSVRLHAPGGLLDAKVNRAEVVRAKAFRSKDPSNLFTYVPDVAGFSNYDDPILFGRIDRPQRLVEFLAARGRLSHHLARFVAEAFEPESGEVAAARWVEVSGVESSSFATPATNRPSSATLGPPAPFSGTGRWSKATDSLRGNLAVALPGLEVRLAGRNSKASLCDYFTVAHHPCR